MHHKTRGVVLPFNTDHAGKRLASIRKHILRLLENELEEISKL